MAPSGKHTRKPIKRRSQLNAEGFSVCIEQTDSALIGSNNTVTSYKQTSLKTSFQRTTITKGMGKICIKLVLNGETGHEHRSNSPFSKPISNSNCDTRSLSGSCGIAWMDLLSHSQELVDLEGPSSPEIGLRYSLGERISACSIHFHSLDTNVRTT